MSDLRGAVATCLVLASALTLAGCQGAGEDKAGPRAGGVHPTIVSLNPCTDAILAQVAGPGQILALSGYSHDPQTSSMGVAAAARYASVSGTVEEVAALAPDIVVASSFLAPASAQALRDLGVRVVTEPIVSTVPQARQQVRDLARLTGHQAAGERLVRHIDDALREAVPPTGWTPVPALVWEAGGLVAGNRTLVADLLKRTGFSNGASARGLDQADYLPLEEVVADPPKVVFAVGNSLAEEDRSLHHPVLSRLKGMMRVPLPRSLLWCGGPTIPRLSARLAQARREWSHNRGTKRAKAAGTGRLPQAGALQR